MKKIITAINNPIINEKLKKEKINIIGKDIQYKEGILEILENNKEINLILINENLPGEIENEELISKIKKINKNIEIIFFIKKENKKNVIKNEKIKQKIKIIKYEKEIKVEDFLDIILCRREIGEKNIDEENKKKLKRINKKNKNNKNFNIRKNRIIAVNGDSAVGKTMTILRLSLYLNKFNLKILIIDLDTKDYKILNLFNWKKINLKKNIENKKEKIKNKKLKIKNNKNFQNNKILKYKIKMLNEKIILNMIININKNINLLFYNKLIKIKKLKKYYNIIFIKLSEKNKKEINNKIIKNSNLNLLILEDNLIGINKLQKIIKNNYIENLEKIKILINKNNKYSIDEKIIKNIFNNIEIIGKIKYEEFYNLLINTNFKNTFMLEEKNKKKEMEKIIKKIIK